MQNTATDKPRLSARADLRALDRALLHRIDPLMAWLGITGRRVGNRWQGGRPGARIEVVLTGANAGAWGAWSADKKGRGLIGVIALERSITYGEAIREARTFIGEPEPADNRRQDDHRPWQAKDAAERAAARAAAIADATGIWRQCVPIDGTPGERYLIDARGNPRPASGWPACLGWPRQRRCWSPH